MRNFIGRTDYLKTLETEWKRDKSSLVAMYGRRRVEKSALIREFSQQKPALFFEGLEGEPTATQIAHFLKQLSLQINEPHLADLKYSDWSDVFDELTWMAASKTKLVNLIKVYWDQQWKQHPHCFLVLCSSIASWMVKNVVKSKALYSPLRWRNSLERFVASTRFCNTSFVLEGYPAIWKSSTSRNRSTGISSALVCQSLDFSTMKPIRFFTISFTKLRSIKRSFIVFLKMDRHRSMSWPSKPSSPREGDSKPILITSKARG